VVRWPSVSRITAAELYAEYRRDLGQIDRSIDFIGKSYLPSLTDSVWVADRAQVQTQLDGLLHGPPEFTPPGSHHADQCFAHRARPVIELGCTGNPKAAARSLAGGVGQPARHNHVQTGQTPIGFQTRQQHIVDETPLVCIKHRNLQVFSRPEMRKHPALGHLHALGQRTDGEPLEANPRRKLKGGVDDGGAGEFAFFHGPLIF
jgi:hypothetical protein